MLTNNNSKDGLEDIESSSISNDKIIYFRVYNSDREVAKMNVRYEPRRDKIYIGILEVFEKRIGIGSVLIVKGSCTYIRGKNNYQYY